MCAFVCVEHTFQFPTVKRARRTQLKQERDGERERKNRRARKGNFCIAQCESDECASLVCASVWKEERVERTKEQMRVE